MTKEGVFKVMCKKTRQTNLHFPPVIAVSDMCSVAQESVEHKILVTSSQGKKIFITYFKLFLHFFKEYHVVKKLKKKIFNFS